VEIRWISANFSQLAWATVRSDVLMSATDGSRRTLDVGQSPLTASVLNLIQDHREGRNEIPQGYIALSDDRDLPLLVTIRNARAITYDQICALSFIEGVSKAGAPSIGGCRAGEKRDGAAHDLRSTSLAADLRDHAHGSNFSNTAARLCLRFHRQSERSCAKTQILHSSNWQHPRRLGREWNPEIVEMGA